MKFQIIRDPVWRDQIKKRWSVKLAALGGAFSVGWAAVSVLPGLQQSLPAWLPPICAGVIFGAAAGAAFLHQPNQPIPPGVDPDGH